MYTSSIFILNNNLNFRVNCKLPSLFRAFLRGKRLAHHDQIMKYKSISVSRNFYYNLLMYTRAINIRTNLGKMYFENRYTIITSIRKANVT